MDKKLNAMKVAGIMLTALGGIVAFVAERINEAAKEEEMKATIQEEVKKQLAEQNKTEGQ